MLGNLSTFILPGVVEYLASTIKNKDSERAKRIFKIVKQLDAVTTQFMSHFADENGNWKG